MVAGGLRGAAGCVAAVRTMYLRQLRLLAYVEQLEVFGGLSRHRGVVVWWGRGFGFFYPVTRFPSITLLFERLS